MRSNCRDTEVLCESLTYEQGLPVILEGESIQEYTTVYSPPFEEFEDYQGVLITGSMYDAHADNPWILKLIALMKGEIVPLCLPFERQ